QSPPRTHSTRRQATRQPRPQPHESEHLVQAERLVERGLNGRNPFRVGIGFGGDWNRIEALWASGELTTHRLGELFLVDVVLRDIDGNDPERWGFPGSSYTIIFTPRDAP
ncbi:hypothetical protein ACFP0N_05770, partial [Kitasatospora aburaviensis]